jgi:hypothetical protein
MFIPCHPPRFDHLIFGETPHFLKSRIAQSVQRRAIAWVAGVRVPAGIRFFFSSYRLDHPDSYPMGTEGDFTTYKAAEA